MLNEDRNDDGAHLLVGAEPYRPSDGLNDVDLTAPGIDKRHTIKGWNIDPFGQTARIGQKPDFIFANRL